MNRQSLDHTIIIPTKDRTQWLEYSLYQYENFKYNGKIMIVDDSNDSNFEINKININNFKNNLNIYHYKGQSKFNKRHKNVASAFSTFLKKINTTYYSSSSDDDIIYTPNLDKCIKFLEQNIDYSAVTAVHYIYDLDKNYNFKKLKVFKGNVCNYNDPLDRLICYANEKGLPHYGVVRTDCRKAMWESEKKLGWPIFSRLNTEGLENFDEELSWNAQIYISGKIGNLNLVQYFRLNSDNIDRLENLSKKNIENNYTLGNIGNVLDGSMTPSCKETFKEFKELIKYEKTQYTDNVIDFSLKQVIWKLIKNYDGAGLFKEDTLYKKEFLKKTKFKKKICINIDYLIIFKFFKILKIIYRSLFFKISTFNIVNKFKANHLKYIKKIFLTN